MSKYVNIEVDCPQCGATGKMKQWEEIDVKENPEYKTPSAQDKIFTYCCPVCGRQITMLHNYTYIDTKKGFIIRLLATDADYKEFENFDSIIGNTKYSEMNLLQRVVTTIGELKQKIEELNSELDDRVIQMIKVLTWQDAESKLNKEISQYNVLFLKVKKNYTIIFSDGLRPIASADFDKKYYKEVEENFKKEIEEYSKGNYIFDMPWAADILLDKMDEEEKKKEGKAGIL